MIKRIINFFTQLFYHRRIIRHLENQLSKDLDIRIQELTVTNGTIDGTLTHPLFKLLASVCADLVKAGGSQAGNFVTCTLFYEGQRYELTVQKSWGKTPAEKIKELQDRLRLYEQAPVPGSPEV